VKPFKTSLKTCIAATLLALSATAAVAADLDIKAPWVRGTVAGQKATGAFMELTTPSGAAIVGVSSPVAGVAEVHEMKMDNGVMKMRPVQRLDIAAGKPLSLAPGGYHVMLMDLKKPLEGGAKFPLTLKFERAGEVTVEVDVQPNPPAPGDHGHEHGATTE